MHGITSQDFAPIRLAFGIGVMPNDMPRAMSYPRTRTRREAYAADVGSAMRAYRPGGPAHRQATSAVPCARPRHCLARTSPCPSPADLGSASSYLEEIGLLKGSLLSRP
ncbi:hypothetical protein L3055_10810 [Corynebacterium sp. MC-02]|nr:hypothetical protein [Corynebacterium pseudokroppenstedtii]